MGIGNSRVMPTLAVTDFKRAREFYSKVLGLQEVSNYPGGETDALFSVGGGYLYIYERPTPSGSTATACAFTVDDVEATVQALRQKGVTFEDYDLPELDLKTEGGIAEQEGVKSAWFKDPSGNILAVDDALAVMDRRGKGPSARPQEELHA